MSTILFQRESPNVNDEDMRQWNEFLHGPIPFLAPRGGGLEGLPFARKVAFDHKPEIERIVLSGEIPAEQSKAFNKLVEKNDEKLQLREIGAESLWDRVNDIFRAGSSEQYIYIVGRIRPCSSVFQRVWRNLEGNLLEWRLVTGDYVGPAFREISFYSTTLSPDGNRLAYHAIEFPSKAIAINNTYVITVDGEEKARSLRYPLMFFDESSNHFAHLTMPGKTMFPRAPATVLLGINDSTAALPFVWEYIEFREFNARGELVVLVYERPPYGQGGLRTKYELAQYRISAAD